MNTLRLVTTEDIKDLFSWINHPLSRKNSFRSTPITWDEHEKWFTERLADTLTTIYILCSDKKGKLGSVRFEKKEDSIRISVMLNPVFIGKKLGSELIRHGIERFIQEKQPIQPILAEIKGDNLPSKKAFLRAGFKEDYVVYKYDR
jgi:UDP-2,4-diacetamido-2,4,6-trideoxy-beta-L-altropyranose hydrolase